MKYALLVLMTEKNSTYKTQLEEYLSKVDCIEDIRYLNISDVIKSEKKAKLKNQNAKVSVKLSLKKSDENTVVSRIQNEIKDLEDRYCMVLPQSLLPSKKFFEYASKALDDGSEALILGLHDNKAVGYDELQSLKDKYTIYTVYNKTPSENDLENCILCSSSLLNSVPSELNGHFAVLSLYQQIIKNGKKAAYAVNERLYFDKTKGNKLISKSLYKKDRKAAKRLGIIPTLKKSFLENIFSIKEFNGRTVYTVLGQSVSVKFKKKPAFPLKAIEAEEKVTSPENIVFKNRRACLFASFTKDGLVSENTLFYLKSLREYCDVIVYVADSKALSETVEKLKQFCDCIIIKRHGEYDFGSYKRGYQYLLDNNLTDKIDSLLICNDSVDFVGTGDDLKEIFTKAKNADAYAMCMSTYGFGRKIKKHRYEWTKNPHLQSYFLVLDKKVFAADYFEKFILGIERIKSKTEIIKRYEMGLSELLREHHVKMDSYYPYDDTNIVNPYAIYLNQYVQKPILVKHMLSK